MIKRKKKERPLEKKSFVGRCFKKFLFPSIPFPCTAAEAGVGLTCVLYEATHVGAQWGLWKETAGVSKKKEVMTKGERISIEI